MKKCPQCDATFKSRNKFCSEPCRKFAFSSSNEIKAKISDGRKKFLAENPDKHPWKKTNRRISAPCEKVKSFLTSKGIAFVEEFQPIADRGFSIDIAFPDIKIGIEVNGNQHYESDRKTLKRYYQDRHNLIVANGWKLIELHYSLCYKPEVLQSLIEKFEQPSYDCYKTEKVKPQTLGPGQRRKLDSDKKYELTSKLILESGIDFSQYGWVGKVAELINISPQKVNRLMRRYLPDLYRDVCFKRRSTDNR